MKQILEELKSLGSPEKSIKAQRFFKAGHGDTFLGVTNPEVRTLVKKYPSLERKEIESLLTSEFHEARMLALLILVHQFKKGDEAAKKSIVNFYLKHKKHINNWDLVDAAARDIIGEWCLLTNDDLIRKLVISKHHWDRRIGIVATHAHIRIKETSLTFKEAENLLTDQEDLMHKATGWMLREAGKKDLQGLKKFLARFSSRMPRTMLRYSIEKFPENERKAILKR